MQPLSAPSITAEARVAAPARFNVVREIGVKVASFE
jgi:hypothetical protein